MQHPLPEHRRRLYERLIRRCYQRAADYPEDHLAAFAMATGTRYNRKLLVIGRATNGWGNGFNKNRPDETEQSLASFLPSIGTDTVDWVTAVAGATEDTIRTGQPSGE